MDKCRYESVASKVNYCPDTGIFTREDGRAVTTNIHGYIKLYNIPAHRLAWYIYYKEVPSKAIDHINRVRNDNRINNLRLATIQENGRNSSKPTTGRKGRKFTSQYKGVRNISRTNKKNPWQARIRYEVGGIDKSLGCYPTEIEAARAYDKAALAYFKEYAALNFPCNPPKNEDTFKVALACNL